MTLANPEPLPRQALVITHDPLSRSQGGRKLRQVLGWNDPDDLARRCIADVQTASHGLARYAVTRRVEVDGFLVQCAALARWSRPAGPTPVCHHGLQL